MLTTVDNPFDPFEQFISWHLFDIEKGYNTSELLARFVELSEDMTQKEIDEEIERAIDEIIFNNPLPIFKKVTRKASNG
jgi:hypothetical protein